tara:strand:+ start:3629 stop:5581 length:1953 start_codon:yes stop_codon:yes gene_type:complete
MSVIGSSILAGASGAAGGGSKVYVDDVFSTYLWNGNYDTTRSAIPINNGIDLAGEGGLVWTKNRNYGNHHQLYDTERNAGNVLYSSLSNGQGSNSVFNSFTSNGFSLTAGTAGTDPLNGDAADTYASWTFRKAPGFFDVVTWNGDDSTQLIPHNLGSTPGFVIAKNINDSTDWYCEHIDTTPQQLKLNDPTGKNSFISNSILGAPNPATHIRADDGSLSAQGQSYVAYVFAHNDQSFGTNEDESIIKCGSFTGIGFKDIGFEPQFLLVKEISGSGNWQIYDNMRGVGSTRTDAGIALYPNTNDHEGGSMGVYFESTGFYNDTYGSATCIYMAIRRPNKPPEDATDVFAIDVGNGSSTIPAFDSGFPVDFAFRLAGYASGGNNPRALSRLQGSRQLYTPLSNGQSGANADVVWDSMSGYEKNFTSNDIAWMFKRAPGFMDVVAYSGTVTGNSDSQTVPHNLGVTPELMLVKRRTGSTQWYVYSDALTNPLTQKLVLNDSGDASATSNAWGTSSSPTAPNANNFTVGYATGTGWVTAGDFVAYLFATLPGISKVGSYSGYTSNAVNVNCGFDAGARFILIKRTNSPGGNWYVWDTTRGIVSGNDPYIILDDAVPQVTNTDYIDPLTTGFTVTASAPAALNATGGTYLFLAIA